MLAVIQFPHPGTMRGRITDWSFRSRQEHRRAFLEAPGEALPSVEGMPQRYPSLRFWAEWEADTMFTAESARGGPVVHRPRIVGRSSFADLHNTDPFVFDGPFLYSNCKQRGELLDLDRGSLIVFGSKREGKFVVDTVFVVAARVCLYRRSEAVAELRDAGCPPSFLHATAGPIQAVARDGADGCAPPACGPKSQAGALTHYALYRGATPDAEGRVEGMFSFAPTSSHGWFARPSIGALGLNEELSQGVKFTRLSVSAIADVWRSIAQRVMEAGLLLGTRFETSG